MPQYLVSMDIGSVEDANEMFGENPGLLVARPSRNPLTTWFTIPEGFYALVSRYGAVIPHPETGSIVWPAGLHYGPPWLCVAYLATKQHFVFDTPVKGCLSKDNVTVQIDVAVVLRIRGDVDRNEDPELVKKFIFNVTPRGLQNQLANAMEEAVRGLARSMNHTEVYGLRAVVVDSTSSLASAPAYADQSRGSTLLQEDPENPLHDGIEMVDQKEEEEDDKRYGGPDTHDSVAASRAVFKGRSATDRMKKALNKQFMPQGVEITDVMITDVELPDTITSQMASKTFAISENAQQKVTQMYDMQQLQFNEEIATLRQTYMEEREKEKTTGQQQETEVRLKLNSMRAEVQKEVNAIENDNKVVLSEIRASTDLEVTKLNQAKDVVLAAIRDAAYEETERLKAETALYCSRKVNEAKLAVARHEAAAEEANAEAQGVIAPMLEKKNMFAIDQSKLDVYKALATNEELVLSDSNNQELNTMLLCDAILKSSKTGEASRSQLLAEMMVMSRGATVTMRHGDMMVGTQI